MPKSIRNRPKTKDKKSKTVVVHKHNFEGGAQELLDRLSGFAKEWTEKHNLVAKDFEEFKRAVAMSVAGSNRNDQIFANSIDRTDINILALSKVVRSIMGHVVELNEVMKLVLGKIGLEAEIDLEAIGKKSDELFKEESASAFGQVQMEREEHEKARIAAEEAAVAAAEAAKKTETDKKEAADAEKELKEAEAPHLDLGRPPGAEIPEGATTFGEGEA